MKYKITDLIVEYDAKYERLKMQSEKYKIENDASNDFEIVLTDEDIQERMKKYINATPELMEYMIIGSRFYRNLLNYHGCLLHSSCVVVENEAYLFSADCGTGKSTHTGLWLKYLADKNPYILNDDKPAIRILDDGIYAYGTPFSGKYDISENKKAKIKGISFIERAETNSIEKIGSSEAISLFLAQTTNYLNKEDMNKLLDVLEIIITQIPIYKLCCNMSKEAVEVAYGVMRQP